MAPRRFLWFFDLIVMIVAFGAVYYFFPGIQMVLSQWALKTHLFETLAPPPVLGGPLPPVAELLWIFLVMAPTTLIILGLSGNHGYLLYLSRTRMVAGSFGAPLVGLALITVAMFSLKSQSWSRIFILSFVLFTGVGLSLYRLVLYEYFTSRRAAGFYAKNILLIGLPGPLNGLIQYFRKGLPAKEYHLLGYLSIGEDSFTESGDEKNQTNGIPLSYLGRVTDLGERLIQHPIHEVIVIYPPSGGEWLKQVIRDCDYFRVALHIVPEPMLTGELKDLQILYRHEPLGLPAVTLMPVHMNSEALFFKRVIDIILSAGLLMLLSPFCFLIMLVIKFRTSHLPVFYPWRVVGRNGVEFTGYKFTTMEADADERRTELMPQNEMNGPVFKIKNDPRITPFGRFLRKYSLNELPQLWSVLKGDMSLVGPRPAFRHELERYEFWHKRKLSVRPGMTCLWQVSGRNRINNFDEWVKMDLEYIDKWSLWLDFKILYWTAWTVIRGTGW